MADIKKNIGANLFGNTWQVLVGLLFIPLYIRFLGVEAYGLVGIFAVLLTLAGILDMGFSATMNREMARRSAVSSGWQEIRSLVRSLEVIYWSVTALIGLLVIALSPLIANLWIKPQDLSGETVQQAILIMGFALALQWPASFYAGGLYGLQKQVLLNSINIAIVTIRGLGAIFILWQISPTIQAFFLWQIFISAAHTFLLAFFLWRNLPRQKEKPSFQLRLIKSIGRFAAGIASISILYTVLTQLDKVILSTMLPLEVFGYYTLAGVVAMSPLRIAGPIHLGIYPKLTQLATLAEHEKLKDIYHKSCQLMSVLVLPFCVVVAFFSYELIFLWTQNIMLADKSHVIASILICGTALHVLLKMPHAIQLAFGWTRLIFYKNLLSIFALVPLIIYMTVNYGAIGAACVWVILNLAGIFFEIPLMHRRILRGETTRWLVRDVLIPLAVALFISGTGKLFIPQGMSQLLTAIYLVIISVLTLGATALATRTTRTWLIAQTVKIGKSISSAH